MEEILTPCILQSIIICCTLIILSVVGVSAYRIHKVEERKKELKIKHTKDGYALGSYIFLGSIVVLVAVLIFSYSFYARKEVLDFMSLASALVSIILAVITIIYSFVINSQTAGQIDKLNVAANSLQLAAEKVEDATSSYKESADSLQTNIQKILNEIKGIGAKIGVDSDYENTVKSGAKAELADAIIKDFCNNTSPAGCVLIYLCSKLQGTTNICNLTDIFAQDIVLYYVGFSIALNSVGLASIVIDLDTHTIRSANVSHNLLAEITKRIEKEIEQQNQFVIEHKTKIDTTFPATK